MRHLPTMLTSLMLMSALFGACMGESLPKLAGSSGNAKKSSKTSAANNVFGDGTVGSTSDDTDSSDSNTTASHTTSTASSNATPVTTTTTPTTSNTATDTTTQTSSSANGIGQVPNISVALAGPTIATCNNSGTVWILSGSGFFTAGSCGENLAHFVCTTDQTAQHFQKAGATTTYQQFLTNNPGYVLYNCGNKSGSLNTHWLRSQSNTVQYVSLPGFAL